MRNLLPFAFALLFISSVPAQIIDFPDANFKARLLQAEVGNGIAYWGGGSVKLDANNNNEIEVSEALRVHHLVLYNCGISDLTGLEYFTNLTQLNCGNNAITVLDLTPFPNLIGFGAQNNNLTSLNVSNLSQLTNFSCHNNQLTSLTLSNLPSVHSILCSQNQLTALDFSGTPNLLQLRCANNQLVSLDLTINSRLKTLDCSNNNLTSLYIKNESDEYSNSLNFSNNPNLEYICADDLQLTQVQDKIVLYGYSNCFVNSYCSFVPGGAFHNISGVISYDEATDGCDASDIAFPNLKLSVSDGTNSGNVFGSSSGNYTYTVQDGTHVIQPILDNPQYFSVSPTSASITFPLQESPYTQHFCITPNGIHPDLSINVQQIDEGYSALPGSDNTYKIRCENKGTNTQSGTISFTFDDAVFELISSDPVVDTQTTNSLLFNFSNLKPFESKEILVTLRLNSDTDTPAVHDGDLLSFTSTIHTNAVDDTPNDNSFILNQVASSIILLGDPTHSVEKYLLVYPNPTADVLTIETSNAVKKESIKVYNTIGQLLIHVDHAEKTSSIDVTKLAIGNYFLIIQTDNGFLKSRFIKN